MKTAPLIVILLLANNVIAQDSLVNQRQQNAASWLKTSSFDPSLFRKPTLSFGPMARWWWPGNNVSKEELKREINLFADEGFAGVEVQPFRLSIPPRDEAERAKVNSWDSQEYYENLRTVMEEARKRGMFIDMTNGSGWPPGGSFLQTEDGFLSLEFADVNITGGNTISLPVPRAKSRTGLSHLEAVIVSRIDTTRTQGKSEPVRLDEKSLKVITSLVKNDTINYSFPAGHLKVIAFWSMPSGEQTNIAASAKQGPVVDHLDSQKVEKLYNYLFGERTGLQPYFGNPMRAIFNDSYEFKANRHYSKDFISYFLKNRGYDITPYLTVNMQKGYNFVAYLRPKLKPDFSLSKEDWRLRYDYDITLSELLGEHFFKTSKTWMEEKGLLHRTQAYGLSMDMMRMAGMASIPETESMLDTEINMKIMTSGALLYNRPIVSAESVVFANRAYTTTPQKMKIAVDKLFAAGVNQIIYHGVPYRYTPEKLGPDGWYPFSSPFLGVVNFASNLGEGNTFWKEQRAVNEYVTRVQYALRSGKARADVLIYYPFISLEGTLQNGEEILSGGYLNDVEGPLPKSKEEFDTNKVAWAEKVYPIINQLEAHGITWSWVNDESLQEAHLKKDGRIEVRGNSFSALILANDSIIQMNTALKIKELASKGMQLVATGRLPVKQPSFLNWKTNDEITKQSIESAIQKKNSTVIKTENEFDNWITTHLHKTVQFQDRYTFTRQAEREMPDGSRIHFIWNKSNAWQTISLRLDKKYSTSYWMDPSSGSILKNTGVNIFYQLPPFGSILLYAGKKVNVQEAALTNSLVTVNPAEQTLSIDTWNIEVDSIELKDVKLFDWKNNEQLKYSSSKAIYSSTFHWDKSNSSKHFFLDLGKVCFTVEVFINGELAGTRVYSPYVLDIGVLLQPGINSIEVRVKPAQLNEFIGRANQGDKRYSQFKGKDDQIMSAGLIGPVVIRPQK